jgi:hypothetical protein
MRASNHILITKASYILCNCATKNIFQFFLILSMRFKIRIFIARSISFRKISSKQIIKASIKSVCTFHCADFLHKCPVLTCALGTVWLTMLLSACVFSGDEMMTSEERQPTEGDECSWSRTISGEAGARWTPDTKEQHKWQNH